MGRSLLLVDDEPDIRLIAGLALRQVGGWTVHEASSGAEALAHLARELPDAIVLDMMMPEMDGLQTLAAIRELYGESLPIVFMTAKVQTHERALYLERGAVGVIAKPFDPMALPRQLAELLAR